MISKPSISMIASLAISSLSIFKCQLSFEPMPEAQTKKALRRLLGHRARFFYGEPDNLFN